MKIVKMSSKRQITIPVDFTKKLKLKPQQKFILETENGELKARPLRKSIVDKLAGSLSKLVPPSKKGVPFSKIREETRKIVAAKIAKNL